MTVAGAMVVALGAAMKSSGNWTTGYLWVWGIGGILGGAGLAIANLLMVAMLLSTPLVWVCCLALAVGVLPFGAGFAFASVSLDLSSEATPPGDWAVSQLLPSTAEFRNRTELSHCTHSDPEALTKVQEWLSIRFGEASQGENLRS